VLVTLMIGYRQLFVPVDSVVSKQVIPVRYHAPANGKTTGGMVYFQEEQEGENDRFHRKHTELNDYFLLFDNSQWEFIATTTIISIVDTVNGDFASAHPAFRVLRL